MRKGLAFMVLALMLLTVTVPLHAEDADGANDIVLYTESDTIQLVSGDTKVIQLFISNNSTESCDMRMRYQHDGTEYSVAFDVTEFVLESGAIQTIHVTLTSKKYVLNTTDTLVIDADHYSFGGTELTCSPISIKVTTQSVYGNEDNFNKILGIFDNPLSAPFDSPLVTAILTMLIWVLIGTFASIFAVIVIYLIIFRRDRGGHDNEKRRLKQMRKFIFAIIILYGASNAMNVYGMDAEIVGTFSELSRFLFVVFGGIIFWKIARVEIESLGNNLGKDSRFDPSIMPLLLVLGEMFVFMATAIIALAIYGVDLMAIIAGLGLLTTGLSFGAKNIINQFLSGVILLTERPFVKKDKIKLDTDVTTTLVVDEVGYMTTKFKNWLNEEMVVIPNNTIMNGMMTNITRDNSLYKVYDYYSISYASDIGKAREIMLEEALANPNVIVDQFMSPPNIHFDEVNRNCVNLRLSFIVNDHENYGSIAAEIRYRIFVRFAEEGVDIPYDQYSINLVRTKRVEDDVNPAV